MNAVTLIRRGEMHGTRTYYTTDGRYVVTRNAFTGWAVSHSTGKHIDDVSTLANARALIAIVEAY